MPANGTGIQLASEESTSLTHFVRNTLDSTT